MLEKKVFVVLRRIWNAL